MRHLRDAQPIRSSYTVPTSAASTEEQLAATTSSPCKFPPHSTPAPPSQTQNHVISADLRTSESASAALSPPHTVLSTPRRLVAEPRVKEHQCRLKEEHRRLEEHGNRLEELERLSRRQNLIVYNLTEDLDDPLTEVSEHKLRILSHRLCTYAALLSSSVAALLDSVSRSSAPACRCPE